MFFDAKAALARIQSEPPANSANSANLEPKDPPISKISRISNTSDPENAVLEAIRSGAQRPGAVATDTQLGATVTYQLVEKLIADGTVTQDRDGTLRLKGVST